MLRPITTVNFDEQHYIELQNKYYEQRSGYMMHSESDQELLQQQEIASTYGEILPEGVATLMLALNLKVYDNFVDLGSGVGKTVLQVFLTTDVKCAYGVEANFMRWRHSEEVSQQVRRDWPQKFTNNRRLFFLHDNILNFDFAGTTIVFANSICYSEKLMRTIVNKINKQDSVRIVMSTQKLSELKHFQHPIIVPIATSWQTPPNKSNCYVYSKDSLSV